MNIVDHLTDLKFRRHLMIDYLKLKTSEEDWHGVADAAMDLRDIDVELDCLEEWAPNLT